MRVYYDKETDSVYIKLSDKKPTGVVEVSELINVDTTEKDEIVGIEILRASQKIPLNSVTKLDYVSKTA